MSVKCTRDKQNEDSSFSILVYPRVPELLYRARRQPARRRRRRLAGTRVPSSGRLHPRDTYPSPSPPRRWWPSSGGTSAATGTPGGPTAGARSAGAAAVGGQPGSAAVREHSERGARRQGWMAERKSASECSGRGPARAGQGGYRFLEHHTQSKIIS